VNEAIRRGLAQKKALASAPKFKFKTFPLGVRPGVSCDDIEHLLEIGEGEGDR